MNTITNHVPRKAVPIPPDWLVDISEFGNIIRTKDFQRLNWVSQLGILDMVYPGAKHSRKEHSFGTLHLTQRICQQLNHFQADERKAFEAYGLLHDIGHTPLSHQLEPLLEESAGIDHHKHGLNTISRMQDAIEKDGVNYELLKEAFQKKHPIVSDKNLGSDKLDYLLRDGFHMGIDAVTNVFTLIQYMGINHNTLAIEEKGAAQAKRLQNYYADIHMEGYLCKQGMISQRMVQRSFEEALNDSGKIDLYGFWDMKDFEVMNFLQNSKNTLACKIFEDIIVRKVYKTAVVFKIDRFVNSERKVDKPIHVEGVTQSLLERFADEYASPRKLTVLEDEVAKELGLAKGELIIPLIPLPRMMPKDVRIYNRVSDDPNTLFTLYPEHERQLKEKYLSNFAIRIAVEPSQRQNVYDKRKEVVGYIASSVLK
jgi:HD superfamily phosphohydrolase